jgi:hypothetical protein
MLSDRSSDPFIGFKSKPFADGLIVKSRSGFGLVSVLEHGL